MWCSTSRRVNFNGRREAACGVPRARVWRAMGPRVMSAKGTFLRVAFHVAACSVLAEIGLRVAFSEGDGERFPRSRFPNASPCSVRASHGARFPPRCHTEVHGTPHAGASAPHPPHNGAWKITRGHMKASRSAAQATMSHAATLNATCGRVSPTQGERPNARQGG